jgi:aspartate kinase
MEQFNDFFTEVEWLLHDEPVREYDYYYDQIVCLGELLSTAIVSAYLNEIGVGNQWIDVRDVFRTDDNFRDAAIDFTFTQQQVNTQIKPLLAANRIVITQGFIGCTDENESTTLGREGSDYTAAVFAYMLDAESVAIWKDVKGIMNADPKQFADAQYISELNYDEVIEMAYYGAQVIHPKTIKPLQNKNIPLYVKCFADAGLPGTVIHNNPVKNLPPIIVVKQNQVLLQLHTKDFSFIGEQPMSDLYEIMAKLHIKPNLIQTHAVNLQLCIDDRPDKVEKLALAASSEFDVQVEKGLTLLSIRHYNNDTLEKLTAGKRIELKQQSPETVQMLLQ